MRSIFRFVIALFALSILGAAWSAAAAETPCAQLLFVRLDHARVTAAVAETVNTISVCRVSVTSKPTPRSDIRFELWIPEESSWNGKFVQLGNGGPAGLILIEALRSVAARGYATANTDGGHRITEPNWADDPVRWQDLSWRAQKETTDLSRLLIFEAKGMAARTSYFAGCSEGGREAMVEAQRFPDDFDGIIAAAPANYWSRLITLYAYTERALSQPGGHLGPDQLALLQKAALGDCGGGTWLKDPAECRFDPANLLCAPTRTQDCLTAPQLASARAMYDGLRFPGNPTNYPGYSPGSEATADNWSYSVATTPAGQGQTFAYLSASSIAMNHLVFKAQTLDLTMLTDAELQQAMTKMAPVMDAADPDLSRFRAHGGKLIQWHGWADAAIPSRGSIMYYNDVVRTMGPVDDFYRLYMIPGMFHCARGPAASDVDWLSVLDGWVTQAKIPGPISTRYVSGGFIEFPVPGQTICPYPSKAANAPLGVAAACVAPGPKEPGV